MRQYELAIRIAQVHHLVDERKYKKALAVIQTLDMRQVRSLSDLKVFAEVYTRTEQYDAAKATYLRIYRRSKTRRILHRLIYLSIRTNSLEDAEVYYQEYVRTNPNVRDALIMRYRIDKAAGVPIGKLIEILQELKQEEYIEEWAYELAKLYHRAGRREECYEECEDIILWFGTGEIVERAKLLIDHLEDHDPMPYYDDKDFTEPKKEEPNPDDTGSLPDLNEYIKERKEQKKEERRRAKMEEDYDDEVEIEADEPDDQEEIIKGNPAEKTTVSEDDFVDDYEETDFEQEGMDFSQKAIDGIQKLSGLLKLGKKEGDAGEGVILDEEAAKPEKEPEAVKKREEFNSEYRHSQSGTGITQDLAREIAAIYEMEHREQLKEKAVTVINEVPDMASNVVERMTQAIQKSANKTYIPLDVEEIRRKEDIKTKETVSDMSSEEALEEVSDDISDDETELEEIQEENFVSSAEQKENDTELLQQLLHEELEEVQAVSTLENYEAPDIPIVETEYMEMPEITYNDLPTTRALQRSFKDVLTLIEGELDPSHFVLMGDGTERIVGVTKQIVRIMKECGYLSYGRIAKIRATQLNKMDVISFRSQLKGNCLLIEEAADLLFPTITKLFSIMEEYEGNIVIVLADEGTTLDQLFRFVPALAKRFKYIIDISKYTKKDYEQI